MRSVFPVSVRAICHACSAFLLLAGGAAADRVSVSLANGEILEGRLTELSPDRLNIVATDGVSKSIAPNEVVRVGLNAMHRNPFAGGGVVWLVNGDRLAVRPLSADDSALKVQWSSRPQAAPVSIPLETIRGFTPTVPRVLAGQRNLFRLGHRKVTGADQVALTNGDELSGEFLGLQDGKLQWNAAGGKLTVPVGNLSLVRLNAELSSFPPLPKESWLLSLRDGSWLTVTTVSLDDDAGVSLKMAFGGELRLPLADIAEMRRVGGRAIWLSTLSPKAFEHQPALSLTWPLQTNRNLRGGPLQLGRREFPFGLGVASRSSIEYDLNGEYTRFAVRVGLDASAPPQAAAVFAIEVDGKRVQSSPPLTSRDEAVIWSEIAVESAKTLRLIVDYGPRLDSGDYANWCDPVLIRSAN